jgi:hypothetical protein
MYAGAYAYGRRVSDPKRGYAQGKRRSSNWRPIDQWQVVLKEHVPAYITWQRYLANQERLKHNQPGSGSSGPVREGCALLPG